MRKYEVQVDLAHGRHGDKDKSMAEKYIPEDGNLQPGSHADSHLVILSDKGIRQMNDIGEDFFSGNLYNQSVSIVSPAIRTKQSAVEFNSNGGIDHLRNTVIIEKTGLGFTEYVIDVYDPNLPEDGTFNYNMELMRDFWFPTPGKNFPSMARLTHDAGKAFLLELEKLQDRYADNTEKGQRVLFSGFHHNPIFDGLLGLIAGYYEVDRSAGKVNIDQAIYPGGSVTGRLYTGSVEGIHTDDPVIVMTMGIGEEQTPQTFRLPISEMRENVRLAGIDAGLR